MKREILAVALAAILLGGCSEDDSRIPLANSGPKPNVKPIPQQDYTEAEVVGKYWATLSADGKKTDQRALLALAKEWFIELDGQGSFEMNMVAPMEGTYSVAGDSLLLNVSKYNDMSIRELEKLSEKMPKEKRPNIEEMRSYEFRILDGGRNLLMMKGQALEPGMLVFQRRA